MVLCCCEYDLDMDVRRCATRMRYGILVAQLLAMAANIWAFAAGLQLSIGRSVLGGLAVMLIAVLLAIGVGWRIRFSWRRLRQGG